MGSIPRRLSSSYTQPLPRMTTTERYLSFGKRVAKSMKTVSAPPGPVVSMIWRIVFKPKFPLNDTLRKNGVKNQILSAYGKSANYNEAGIRLFNRIKIVRGDSLFNFSVTFRKCMYAHIRNNYIITKYNVIYDKHRCGRPNIIVRHFQDPIGEQVKYFYIINLFKTYVPCSRITINFNWCI